MDRSHVLAGSTGALLASDDGPILAALVDGRTARIFELAGRPARATEAPVLRADHRRAAAWLGERLLDGSGVRIIVRGGEGETRLFRAKLFLGLPRAFRNLLTERLVAHPTGDAVDGLLAAAADREELRARRVASEVLDRAVTRERATAGLLPTLGEANRRNVESLVLHEGFEAKGGQCPGCGWLHDEESVHCPRCALRLEPVLLGSALAEATAAAGGVIETLRDSARLRRAGGVAALLRT